MCDDRVCDVYGGVDGDFDVCGYVCFVCFVLLVGDVGVVVVFVWV